MTESEFKIESLFINLRWFYLIAVTGIIGIDTIAKNAEFPRVVILLLILGGIANMVALIALLQKSLSYPIRTYMLLQDIGLTLGFIAGSGGTESPLLFVALVPITTAAMSFQWISCAIMIVCTVLIYWLIAWQQAGLSFNVPIGLLLLQIIPYLTNGIILLLAGFAVSRTSNRIKQSLLDEREEKEQEAEVALNSAHQRVRLIFELASTLSATLNYERVLEAALDVSNAGLKEFFGDKQDITQVGLVLLFGMDETLYVAKSRGISHRDERVRLPAQHGVLAEAIEKTLPVVLNKPASDPELQSIMAFQMCKQAIVVPLRAGFESYGLLVLASPEPHTYESDFQDLLVAISNQAVMALQNANLYQNLMEEKDRLVTVEEDARKKLARDLHDGPTQTIAAIAMRLNYIRMLVERDPKQSIEELHQLENLARTTTKEIRQMLFTLRPLILETQGLVPALEQLLQKLSETQPIPIHLEADREAADLLSKEAQGSIFYIVEEALTNARKHAGAENLWIRIYQRGMKVLIEIEDDGKGFDIAKVEASYDTRGSLGMRNLHERAVLVKGKTVIQSTPGQGTKITVTIPVDVAEAQLA